MKNTFLILMILFSSIIYGQSLNDLLNFKTMSLNQIEEKLILEDWSFNRSENKTKNTKPKSMWDFEPYSYQSKSYEYIGYKGDKTTMIIIDYADKTENEIKITGENKLLYKNILEDMISANFRVTNERCPYLQAYLGDYNIGDQVTIESNGKVYKLGNQKIYVIINRYAIVTGKNSNEQTFLYNQNEIIDEYKIIVN